MNRKLLDRLDRLPERLVGWTPAGTPFRRAVYRYVDARDRRRAAPGGPCDVPPAALRFRVHGDLDVQSFLETGRRCHEDVRAALDAAGRDLGSFHEVLDFGCGCGRTLRWFGGWAESARFRGTDIDAEAIDWCRGCIQFASFSVNASLPPLEFRDETFDLIYAISVFTHMTEDVQFRWLGELARVAMPGAYVVVTLRGPSHPLLHRLPPEDREELGRHGFVFSKTAHRFLTNDLATHTESYVRERYTRDFAIAAYLERALDGSQDVVVLRKR